MLRAMIVDDEMMVRTALEKMVDWEAEGFVLEGSAHGLEMAGTVYCDNNMAGGYQAVRRCLRKSTPEQFPDAVFCGSSMIAHGAIRAMWESGIPRDQWPKPHIDTGLCTACSMCVLACGFDCLSISLPREKGDLEVFARLSQPEKCVGCGLCAKACGVGAITMEGGEGA